MGFFGLFLFSTGCFRMTHLSKGIVLNIYIVTAIVRFYHARFADLVCIRYWVQDCTSLTHASSPESCEQHQVKDAHVSSLLPVITSNS